MRCIGDHTVFVAKAMASPFNKPEIQYSIIERQSTRRWGTLATEQQSTLLDRSIQRCEHLHALNGTTCDVKMG